MQNKLFTATQKKEKKKNNRSSLHVGSLPGASVLETTGTLRNLELQKEKAELKALYKVERLDIDGKHFYSVNNSTTYFIGVTSALETQAKDALLPWAARITTEYIREKLDLFRSIDPSRINDKFLTLLMKRGKKQHRFQKNTAGLTGTMCHALYEDHIKGETCLREVSPELQMQIDSFLLWLEEEQPEFVLGDTKIASPTFGYGGSIDALGIDSSGRYYIIDFKTSGGIYDSHAKQVAAYAFGFRETYGLDYTPEAMIVRFGKKRVEAEVRWIRSTMDSFLGFKAALDSYKNNQLESFSTRKLIRPIKKGEKTNAIISA